MRILEVTYEFPPVGGGGGIVTRDISIQLAKAGHTIDVITMAGPGATGGEEIFPGLTVYRVPALRRSLNYCRPFSAAIYLITASLVAALLLLRRHYDLIHATFILPSGIVAALAAHIFNKPLVITAHGSDVPHHNPALSGYFHWLKKVWLKVVDSSQSIITISEYLRSLIVHNLLTSRAPKHPNVMVISNAVDPANFPQTNYEKRILVVARLRHFKGIQYFLKALENFDLRGYEVIIAGDGPYRDDLEKLAEQLKVSVKFAGRLSRSELITLYAHSSVLISASLFESFGGVLMEAMACGLAVVATDVGGCAELIGRAGLLVPAENPSSLRQALERLLSNPAYLHQLGQQARLRIQKEFNIHRSTERTIHCFKDAIKTYES